MHRHPRLVAALLLSLLALPPGTAHASVFGEENAPLYTLVAQSASQLTQLSQALAVARQTYDETRRYVGMLDDARASFEGLRRFGAAVVARPDTAFGELFPDAAYLRRELSAPDAWRQGTGELQRRVRLCYGGGAGCADFYEGVRAQQARAAVAGTFGALSAEATRPDVAATDAEAAQALALASGHEGRAALSRARYEALLTRCTGGDETSCQGAAHLAAILGASGTADTNEQLATLSRLGAVQAAHAAAQRKREVLEAQQRRRAVLDGFEDVARVRLVPAGAVPVATEVP